MTAFLALLAILVPASVTLVGYWFKQQAERRLSEEQEQADKRLAQEQKHSEKQLAQERQQENDRLRLDAAIRAAELFSRPSNGGVASAAMSAPASWR